MRRVSIARLLLLALVGLTVALGLVAALAVAGLYDSRRDFEGALARTYAGEAAASALISAGVVEETVLGARSPAPARRRAAAGFAAALADVRRTAGPDDAALIARAAAGQRTLRRAAAGSRRAAARDRDRAASGGAARGGTAAGGSGGTARDGAAAGGSGGTARDGAAAGGSGGTTAGGFGRAAARRERSAARALRRAQAAADRGRDAAVALADRQVAARRDAQARATSRSRRALITAGAAGLLAVLGAAGLVVALIASLRRPLDALVGATGRLADGDLAARVAPGGPAELRDLSGSFNAMADELETAQARIEAARERLSTVVESLGDGLVLCTADGVVEQVNPRAEVLVPELAAGTDLRTATGPLPALDDALEREIEVDHAGRTLTVTAARLGPTPESGVVFTVRDSTERVQLERAKSDFVATASHELRSPLTSIKGFVELLAGSDLPERQKEFVRIVLLSTNRLVELVNDLLDVARVEAGQLQIAPRPTPLTELVTDVAQLMEARFAERDQTLVVDADPDLPAAWADPERVRQIVTNLVTNAHLYTPDGGAVEIRLGADPDADAVVLAVRDTGRGMTAEQLEHAFDRFFRVDGTTASGTGLGLPIVKSLVELHGGSIALESTPGEGTTATVRLPRALAATELTDPGEALRGRQVLVADDEPEVARLIAELLTEHGVAVTTAGSGGDALRKLRAGTFDALTLDVLLGDRDGRSVLADLRDDPSLARLPVVLVSVRAGTDDLGGEWSVEKPIDPDTLLETLGSAVLAARARVLVVAGDAVRDRVAADLETRGLDVAWAPDAASAASLAERQHFEIALVDTALGAPEDVTAGVTLRGRRLRPQAASFDSDTDPATAVMQALRVATGVAAAR